MSRCFPYPPVGYNVSSMESFKLQKKNELVKEKKEKKRHRKDKREKGQKRSDNAQHKHKKRKLDEKNLLEQKIDNCTKRTCDQAELLDRSGLTEEHDLPCNVRKSEFSDSSLDSKRRKIATCVGTKVCIKLPVPKQDDHEPARIQSKANLLKLPSLVREEPKASVPRRIFLPSQSSARIQQKFPLQSSINLEPQPSVRPENKDLVTRIHKKVSLQGRINLEPQPSVRPENKDLVTRVHKRVSLQGRINLEPQPLVGPENNQPQSSVRLQNKASGPNKIVLKPPSLVRKEVKASEPRRVVLPSQSSARVQKKVPLQGTINLEAQPLLRPENKDLAARAHKKVSLQGSINLERQPSVRPENNYLAARVHKKVSLQGSINLETQPSVRPENNYLAARVHKKVSLQGSINLETQPSVRPENKDLAARLQKKVSLQPLVRPKNNDLAPNRAVLKPREEVLSQTSYEPCSSGLETCLDREANKTATCSTSRKSSKGAEQFTSLSWNFNFPPLDFESWDAGDQQWLFGAPKQAAGPAASCQGDNRDYTRSTTVCTETSFEPRSCYLPEFDMYQLPYVMPF